MKNFLHDKRRAPGLTGDSGANYEKLAEVVFEAGHFQSHQNLVIRELDLSG